LQTKVSIDREDRLLNDRRILELKDQ